MKILVIGPAWVGDMVMAQTLFKLLKQRAPEVTIHVLAPMWTSPLLERMPEVSKVLALPIKHGALALRKRYVIGKHLRHEHYDQAIALPNSFKSALIPFWARIPCRIGWRGEMRYGLLNDRRILDKTKLPLMIERFAALGLDKNAVLPKELPWPKLEAKKLDDAVLQKFGLNHAALGNKILALCPGAEYGAAKRWPASYFAEVARAKLAAGWQVWLFGGNKDQAIAAEIQQHTSNGCVDLTGKTSLAEVIDFLAIVSVVVSNDSGLMHIAASLERPLVVIYGSSSPKFTPPLTKDVSIISLNLPCSPCFKRECPFKHYNCLYEIKPQKILDILSRQ